MNALINSIWGNNLFSPGHLLYLENLSMLKNCTKIVTVQDMSVENIKKLEKYYDHIEVINKPFSCVSLDYAQLKLIEKSFSHCEYVLFTDSFDVVFQSDPFEYISKFDEDLFFTSPGFLVKEQWPDRNWHEYYNKTLEFRENFSEDRVLNGGFRIGKTKAFLDFYVFLVSNENRNGRHIINQTVFNHYYHLVRDRGNVKIFDTRLDNFAYHCQNEHFFNRKENPKIIDGEIYFTHDQKYCIWHQYEDVGYEALIDSNCKPYIALKK